MGVKQDKNYASNCHFFLSMNSGIRCAWAEAPPLELSLNMQIFTPLTDFLVYRDYPPVLHNVLWHHSVINTW